MDHRPARLRAVQSRRVNDPELTAEPTIEHQNYVKDLSMLRIGRADDGTMEFKVAPGVRKLQNNKAESVLAK